MKPTMRHTLFPALLLSLLLSASCKKDKEAEDEKGDDNQGGTPSGEGGGGPGGPGGGPGAGEGMPGGPGGGPGGGEGMPGGPGGGEFGEGPDGGPGGGEFGEGPGEGPGGGQQQPAKLDPNKPPAPQLNWGVNTGRFQPPGQDIRVIYMGKNASIIIRAFGRPTNAKAVGSNGVWTYPGMKIRDAQGKTYNAVRFTIQPTSQGDGKVIAVEVIPGAIAGGGQNSGGGPGGPGGPGGGPPGAP